MAARHGIVIGVLDLEAKRCCEPVASIQEADGEARALGADIFDPVQIALALAAFREALA